MSLFCEYKKCRRSGLFPVFLAGGLLAAAVPAMNMFFRSELYLHRPQTPLTILLEANWQMMGMLNLFLVLAGASVLYHMEFADRAFLRMETLPQSMFGMFIRKYLVLVSVILMAFALEAASLAGVSICWFGMTEGMWNELGRQMGCLLVKMLPALALMLAVSSASENLWITLGVGVTGIFAALILSGAGRQNHILQLFPFLLPLETAGTDGRLLLAAGAETAAILAAGQGYLCIRRRFR